MNLNFDSFAPRPNPDQEKQNKDNYYNAKRCIKDALELLRQAQSYTPANTHLADSVVYAYNSLAAFEWEE